MGCKQKFGDRPPEWSPRDSAKRESNGAVEASWGPVTREGLLMRSHESVRPIRRPSSNQRGYILLSVMLLMTLMLIALTIEAPRIAQQIRREKEEELIHRGNEYKAAIKKFFRKMGRYPASLEELTTTNNTRFLRKRYVDPFTGKDDWRVLHPGEVQINVLQQGTNAPGQPIGGAAGSTIGNPGGMAVNPGGMAGSPGIAGNPGGVAGNPGAISGNSTSLFPSQPAGGAQNQPGTPAANSQSGQQPGGTMGLNATMGGNSPVTFGGGQIIGVSSTSKSESIKEINGKDHYNEWYFVYDPRLEQQNTPPGSPGIAGTNPVGGMAPGQNPGLQNAPGLFGQQNQNNPPGQINPPPQPPPIPRNPQ
jgi:type II secretory pathway pseudopilin PulG